MVVALMVLTNGWTGDWRVVTNPAHGLSKTEVVRNQRGLREPSQSALAKVTNILQYVKDLLVPVQRGTGQVNQRCCCRSVVQPFFFVNPDFLRTIRKVLKQTQPRNTLAHDTYFLISFSRRLGSSTVFTFLHQKEVVKLKASRCRLKGRPWNVSYSRLRGFLSNDVCSFACFVYLGK